MVALAHPSPLERPGGRFGDRMSALFDGSARSGLVEIPGALPAPSLTCELRLASVPTLISMLRGGKHTGALAVLWAGGGRALFFERGELTGCTTTHKADRLGEVLWRSGRLRLDQLIIAGAHLRPGVKLGRCLVELGYVQSAELYACLKMQALAVLKEACLMEDGVAAFIEGVTLRNPLRMEQDTRAIVGDAYKLAAECKTLERELGRMDAPVLPTWPIAAPVDEAEAAMLQLAASARPPLTRLQLLERVELGRLEGLRTLHSLMRRGVVHSPVELAEVPDVVVTPIPLSRLERLQMAVESIVAALHDAGFATRESLREFLASPPDAHARALKAVGLREGTVQIDWVAVGSLDDGSQQLEDALAALLDFAMFEARDVLDEAELERLVDELMGLGVLA